MIQRARMYIKPHVENGKLVRYVLKESDLTIQEMIMVICLLEYYLFDKKDVFQECINLFENRIESVCKLVITRAEPKADDDFTVDMVLASEFQDEVSNRINHVDAETDLKNIVKLLYEEYFDESEVDHESLDDNID